MRVPTVDRTDEARKEIVDPRPDDGRLRPIRTEGRVTADAPDFRRVFSADDQRLRHGRVVLISRFAQAHEGLHRASSYDVNLRTAFYCIRCYPRLRDLALCD